MILCEPPRKGKPHLVCFEKRNARFHARVHCFFSLYLYTPANTAWTPTVPESSLLRT